MRPIIIQAEEAYDKLTVKQTTLVIYLVMYDKGQLKSYDAVKEQVVKPNITSPHKFIEGKDYLKWMDEQWR